MFPSGAVSWKAHEESFIKNLNVFDELKFRFSYGISGNQGISPYQTLSRYGTDKYYNDGSWATTIGPGYVSGWTADTYYRIHSSDGTFLKRVYYPNIHSIFHSSPDFRHPYSHCPMLRSQNPYPSELCIR